MCKSYQDNTIEKVYLQTQTVSLTKTFFSFREYSRRLAAKHRLNQSAHLLEHSE